jgi:hypothetical protein
MNLTATGAAPQVSGDIGLSLMQKVELRLDKREGCRKQAQAQGLGLSKRSICAWTNGKTAENRRKQRDWALSPGSTSFENA